MRGFPSTPDFGVSRARAFWFLFLATASHALLDAMTNGGLGVEVFWPFETQRYFLPFRPLQVSPIGVSAFLSERGLAVLRSELVWLWLPAAMFAGVCLARRRLASARR